MGILEVLTLIFVVLKLTGITAVATWSWWLVLLPEIVSFLLYAIFFIIAEKQKKAAINRFNKI